MLSTVLAIAPDKRTGLDKFLRLVGLPKDTKPALMVKAGPDLKAATAAAAEKFLELKPSWPPGP
jgi:hypothetical protein